MRKKEPKGRYAALITAVVLMIGMFTPVHAAEKSSTLPNETVPVSSQSSSSALSSEQINTESVLELNRSSLFFGEPGTVHSFTAQASKDAVLTISSSNPEVAQAQIGEWDEQQGGFICTVSAEAAGKTTITVTDGKVVRELSVTVAEKAAGSNIAVWLDTTCRYTFKGIGKSYTVKICTTPDAVPQCTSMDPSVMTVSKPVWSSKAKGYFCTLTSVGEGDAALAVQAGGTRKVLNVSVVIPPVHLWADTSSYQFGSYGQSYIVFMRTSPDTRPVVTSDDQTVVTAGLPVWDQNVKGYLCRLTAGKEGETVVTITAGKTVKKIPIKVAYQPAAIYRDTYSYRFQTPGQEYTMLFRTAGNLPLQITSSNQDSVTVGSINWNAKWKGYLCTMRAGGKAGSAVVTATVGSSSVTIPVTVDLKPVPISLDTTSYHFYYRGQHYTLLTKVSASVPALISSTDSSKISIQTVQKGNGVYLTNITALQEGQADVIVRAGSRVAHMPVQVSFVPIQITASESSHRFSNLHQSCTVLFHTSYNLAPQISTSNSWIASAQSLGWDAGRKGYLCRVTSTGTGAAAITAQIGRAASSTIHITVTCPDPMLLRAQNYNSSTGYLLLVDTAHHKVGVYRGRKGSWNQVYKWDCANGAAATPTVKGQFQVGSRGYYFDSGYVRCFYYTQIYGNYLFHSVLYRQTSYPAVVVDGRVGMALSHGCVRLKLENAKWIYQNIPYRTKVAIY